ncbi:MAG: NAD-dependent epimerase/dehydratase family protein, partial [Puniceicoccales bacterium]|nr:NAD-dependent epimerase/dehydratase family protein [Puniceicoccales bacterium]
MPTLVIFGFGYIGSAVAEKAVALGWKVRVLVRSEAKAAELREQGIDVVVGDIADRTWHERLEPKANYVLNAVSASGGDYERTYVEGNRSLMAWASQGQIDTLVYTSSTGVYPHADGAWLDEASAVKEDDIFVRAENVILAPAVSLSPVRYFILRLGGVYGPRRHYLLDTLRQGQVEIPGRGDFYINFIHRDDAVRAILAAFAAPAEIRNQVY